MLFGIRQFPLCANTSVTRSDIRNPAFIGVVVMALSAVLTCATACGASENWPFVIVRCYGSHAENRVFNDRLFAAQERHPGLVDEIWFCGDRDEAGDPAAVGRAAAGNLSVAETCRRLGIRFSFQAWALEYAADDACRARIPEDAWMVSSDGRVNRDTFCCTSPFVKDFGRARVESALGVLKPDSYWVDDDLRADRSGSVPGGCFCARCLRLFSESVGRPFDRAVLMTALKGAKSDSTVRKAWCAFNARMLGEYAKGFRAAADAISPSTRVCLQGCWAAMTYEGENARKEVLSALAGDVGTGVRPGGGYYGDDNPNDLLFKGASVARDAASVARLPYVKQVCYEAENWPHIGSLKSPGGMMSECAYMLAVGCDSLALYWGSDINGESDASYDFFFETLALWKPFLLAERDAFCGTLPCGLAPFFGEGRYATSAWAQHVDCNVVAALARNGLPMADSLAAPDAWHLSSLSVNTLRTEDLRMVFSKGVLMDVKAFRRLVERFPELCFAKKVSFKDAPRALHSWRDASFERFARHGQCGNLRAYIFPQTKDVRAFSTMSGATNACGTCVIPTEFGGKVVLAQDVSFPADTPSWMGPQRMWPGCRRAGILDALDAAVPGGMPVRLLTDGYAVIVVARKAADGRTAGAFLFNFATGETPPLELAIRRGATASWRVWRPKSAPSAADMVREADGETVLRLPPLPAFGVAAILPGK